MKFTGERLIPSVYDTNRILYYQHLVRYRFAKQYIEQNDRVLDIACGTGYGTYEIASKAKEVYGVDIDANSIAFASKEYNVPNLKYLCGDATNLSFLDGVFNSCISFETIEHLSSEQQNIFLNQIINILEPTKGRLIISTPNKSIFNSGHIDKNHFHQKEFEYHEFKNFLLKYFKIVYLFGQKNHDSLINKKRLFKFIEKLSYFKKEQKFNLTNSQYIYNENDIEFMSYNVQECPFIIAVCRNPLK